MNFLERQKASQSHTGDACSRCSIDSGSIWMAGTLCETTWLAERPFSPTDLKYKSIWLALFLWIMMRWYGRSLFRRLAEMTSTETTVFYTFIFGVLQPETLLFSKESAAEVQVLLYVSSLQSNSAMIIWPDNLTSWPWKHGLGALELRLAWCELHLQFDHSWTSVALEFVSSELLRQISTHMSLATRTPCFWSQSTNRFRVSL